MYIHLKYFAEHGDQVMFLQAEIDDGIHKEMILTDVSVELREKLVPFILSFQAE